jgi:hypothetical protein
VSKGSAAFSIAQRQADRRLASATYAAPPATPDHDVTPVSRRSLSSVLTLLAAFVPGACTPVAVTAEVAYARLRVDGDLAIDSGSAAAQDIEAAFGLGSERDAPYARVTADFGGPELRASGFLLREGGAGVLSSAFGGLPAGTAVTAALELGNAKLVADWPLALGAVTVAPGVAFDVFAIDFRATSSPGNYEEVDDVVGVPLPFVRAAAALGDARVGVEVGWLDASDLTGTAARFADLEASAGWQLSPRWSLAAGYRWLSADAEGETATDTVAIDLRVHGWFVGGGIVF